MSDETKVRDEDGIEGDAGREGNPNIGFAMTAQCAADFVQAANRLPAEVVGSAGLGALAQRNNFDLPLPRLAVAASCDAGWPGLGVDGDDVLRFPDGSEATWLKDEMMWRVQWPKAEGKVGDAGGCTITRGDPSGAIVEDAEPCASCLRASGHTVEPCPVMESLSRKEPGTTILVLVGGCDSYYPGNDQNDEPEPGPKEEGNDEPRAPHKIGDLVMLASGGHAMVVTYIEADGVVRAGASLAGETKYVMVPAVCLVPYVGDEDLPPPSAG